MTTERVTVALTLALALAATASAQFQLDHVTAAPAAGDLRVIVTGDFDGDQLDDVVYAESGQPFAPRLLLNMGGGDLTPMAAPGLGGFDTGWLAAGDLDGDGDLDLVGNARLISQGGFPPSPTLQYGLAVGLNDGSGSFTVQVTAATYQTSLGLDGALGDADGDGDLDVFVLGSRTVVVLVNDGAGGMTEAGVFASFDPATLPSPVIIAPTSIALVAGDVDGDGVTDVAVLQGSYITFPFIGLPSNQATVLTNDGAGNLAPTATLATSDDPSGLTLADLNGDGHDELVVASPDLAAGGLDVFTNDQAGGFTHAALTVGARALEVHAADVTGDGERDLVVLAAAGNPSSGHFVAVLAGDGVGGFPGTASATPVDFFGAWLTARHHAAFRIADVDGDGQSDVVLAARSTNRVRVLGTAPRSFPILAGSADDLVIATGIGGAPPTSTPPADVKTAPIGSTVRVEITSPGGTFVGDPLHLLGGPVSLLAPPAPVTGTTNVYFAGWILLVDGHLDPGGWGGNFSAAPWMSGYSLLLQGLVMSPSAANGAYAATDAHVIVF